MSERTCARDGCGNTLDHMGSRASYCSNGCRTAAYKEREGIVGYKPVRAPGTVLNGRRGGTQLSYRKVVAEMRRLTDLGVLAGRQLTVVEERLHDLVPDRQRRSA